MFVTNNYCGSIQLLNGNFQTHLISIPIPVSIDLAIQHRSRRGFVRVLNKITYIATRIIQMHACIIK